MASSRKSPLIPNSSGYRRRGCHRAAESRLARLSKPATNGSARRKTVHFRWPNRRDRVIPPILPAKTGKFRDIANIIWRERCLAPFFGPQKPPQRRWTHFWEAKNRSQRRPPAFLGVKNQPQRRPALFLEAKNPTQRRWATFLVAKNRGKRRWPWFWEAKNRPERRSVPFGEAKNPGQRRSLGSWASKRRTKRGQVRAKWGFSFVGRDGQKQGGQPQAGFAPPRLYESVRQPASHEWLAISRVSDLAARVGVGVWGPSAKTSSDRRRSAESVN